MIEGAGATAAYAALAVLITWPLTLRLGSHVIGAPDSDMGATVAWLWTLAREEGYELVGATTHTLTGAPLGWEQGNALNVQWLLPYYPAYLVTLVAGEVAAYNLTILSGLTLSSLAMYVLARRLGCHPLVAGWAGLVYMLFPWHLWRLNTGHASLVHLQTLPLLFIALHAWTVRPTRSRTVFVGVAAAAAWLTSGYWGAMGVIGALVFMIGVCALRIRPAGPTVAARQLALGVLALIAGSAAIGLLSLPGRTAGGITIPRSVGELSFLGARPLEFVLPDAENPLLGGLRRSLAGNLHGSNPSETTLFVGWLTMALAAFWLVHVLRRRRGLPTSLVATTGGLLAAGVAGLAFAAPSPIDVAGRVLTWTPSWFLFQILPEVRVPSRFVALVATAVVPLAALGLQLAGERVSARRTSSSGGLAFGATIVAALAVSVVELFPNVLPDAPARLESDIYEAVDSTPEGILVEYPIDEGSDYRFWQRMHGRRLLNGARVGTEAEDLARQVVNPAAPGTAELLSLLGVTAIVTRPDALDYTDGVPDVPNANWGLGYELVARFGDGGSAWRVIADPASAIAVLRSPGFGRPSAPRDGFVGYPLVATEGTIQLRARKTHVALLRFVATAPDGRRERLRIAGAGGDIQRAVSGRASISLPVLVPRGRSQLVVSAAATTAGLELSAPSAQETQTRPVLRASPTSPHPGF